MLKGSTYVLKYTYTGRTQILKLFQKQSFTKIHERSFQTMTTRKPQKVLPSQIKNGTAEIPLIIPLGGSSCSVKAHSSSHGMDFPKKFSKEELKAKLTPQEYSVTQESGTERAFTGRYWDNHRKGIYKCVVCGEDLFTSDTKFESGSGWPSFYDVLEKGKVKSVTDNSMFMTRTEVLCAQCGAHLGHVFDDGPRPTGKRYCMNSCSMKFKEDSASTPDAKSEL